MGKIRLNGHHIDRVYKKKHVPPLDPISMAILLRKGWRIYGREFVESAHEIMNSIEDQTIIVPVRGNDVICESGCPYEELCGEGRKEDVSRLQYERTPWYLKILGKNKPSNDEFFLERYGLELAKEYAFGDIIDRKKKHIRWI